MAGLKITNEKLQKIIQRHSEWLNSNDTGERADLADANLIGADMRGANLIGANLSYANMRDANMRDADLVHLKIDEYAVFINSESMQIGCQNHKHNAWFGFDLYQIASMHYESDEEKTTAVERWEKWKPVLKAICTQVASDYEKRKESNQC